MSTATKAKLAALKAKETSLRKEAAETRKVRMALEAPSTPIEIASYEDAWAKRGAAVRVVKDEETGKLVEEKIVLNWERLTKEQQAHIDGVKKVRAAKVAAEQDLIVKEANQHVLVGARMNLRRTHATWDITKKRERAPRRRSVKAESKVEA